MSPNILASPFQGQQFKIKADGDVEGNPLLFDNWKSGEVILANGETYHLEKINFDASGSKFIYSKNDTIYEVQDNVNEVRINGENAGEDSSSEMLFRNDVLPKQSSFVQVLIKGKITILRKFDKKPEGENYSNGIVNNTRKYVLHTEDVAVVDNKIIPVKYSSSTLEELTSDKKSQVDSFIKSNNLKPKKEDDFLKSINFYNSIN
jgi:hypothetical protein